MMKIMTFTTFNTRYALSLLALCLLMVLSAFPAHANKKYASIVIDADTGAVVSQRYADKVLHPASLTKMMTMMMAFEALENRKISLNDRIRISHHAASMQPSKLDLPAGSTIKVDDAIKALAVKSANDIAVAMAEFLGGSETNFANMMTKKAQSIGMSKTRFMNASGLHDPRQVTTARDMARLSRYLIHRYPDYYHYFSMKSFSYRGKTYGTHHHLMKTYPGMDGLKTGYILASGFNLAASAKQDGRRLIGVVFGGRTSRSRNDHMKVILDRGFSAIKKAPYYKIIKAPTTDVILAKVPVPPRKPGYDPQAMIMADAISSIEPAAGAAILAGAQEKIVDVISTTWQNRQQSRVNNLIGQGDIDDDSAMRFQTGLMAIAAHTGKEYSIDGIGNFGGRGKNRLTQARLFTTNMSASQNANLPTNWSVQLGAYNSRSQTDSRMRSAYNTLPNTLRYGRSMIMPVRVNDTILFRGRLSGYTEDDAKAICNIVKDCMVIAP
jgi:D-alanyl-D-alanine carboxypeptidase